MAEKILSVICFHDEFCRICSALMTALSLLKKEGPTVTIFFGSRDICPVCGNYALALNLHR